MLAAYPGSAAGTTTKWPDARQPSLTDVLSPAPGVALPCSAGLTPSSGLGSKAGVQPAFDQGRKSR